VKVSPALQAGAPDLEGLLVDLYQRVSPGVVAIRVYGGQGPSMDVPMDFELPTGQGSGFVYDKEGHIVTNYHVVADGEKFEVVFANGDKAWAEIVGVDQGSDLAVLRVQDVPESQLVPLPVGDSDQVKPGQIVVALGNPFGLRGSMTLGIVSARGRTLPSEQMAQQGGVFSMGDLIQTDAAINPGNSGGPLLNLEGEVIGVNRAIRTDGPVRGNVGVNWVRMIVPELIRSGEFVYPYLGIQARDDLPRLRSWTCRWTTAFMWWKWSPVAPPTGLVCRARRPPTPLMSFRRGATSSWPSTITLCTPLTTSSPTW